MTIYNNIYPIEMKRFAGVNPEYFKKCIEVVRDIPVYRIQRPKGVMRVDAQIAWIKNPFLNSHDIRMIVGD